MSEAERIEFERLVEMSRRLKKQIKNLNRKKRKIQEDIKRLGELIDETERKYSKRDV